MTQRKQTALYALLLLATAITSHIVSSNDAIITPAFAKSITISSINQIKTLSIESTTNTVREINLGATNPISSVPLKFKDTMSNKNISIELKDIDNNMLGSGTGSIGALPSDTVSITLANQVDSGERANLAKITITIT